MMQAGASAVRGEGRRGKDKEGGQAPCQPVPPGKDHPLRLTRPRRRPSRQRRRPPRGDEAAGLPAPAGHQDARLRIGHWHLQGHRACDPARVSALQERAGHHRVSGPAGGKGPL